MTNGKALSLYGNEFWIKKVENLIKDKKKYMKECSENRTNMYQALDEI